MLGKPTGAWQAPGSTLPSLAEDAGLARPATASFQQSWQTHFLIHWSYSILQQELN